MRAPAPIERIPFIDRETLQRDHLARGRPLLIEGDHRAWRTRWASSSLRARHGGRPIATEETRRVYVGERARRERTLTDLIDAVDAGERAARWKGDLLAHAPELAAELAADPAPLQALLPSRLRGVRNTLWISPGRTSSSLHHDGDFDNLNLQISGAKVFLLFPPSERRRLHCYGSAESPIDAFAPDLDRFPRCASLRPIEARLRPGDTLFIPRYWFHCVRTLEPSVNLSTHFGWDGEPTAFALLEGAPLLHRALTALSSTMKRRGAVRSAELARGVWRAIYEVCVPRVEPQPR